MIDVPIAPKGTWSGYVSLAFAKCSSEKFEEIQKERSNRYFRALIEKMAGPGLMLFLFVSVMLGLVEMAKYFGVLLLWIFGKV